jgi:hypothetical protein
MNPTRVVKREDLEKTQQYTRHQETLLVKDMIDEKLIQLQVFIGQLSRTPQGLAELQRRTRCFGACERITGETSGRFYARLRLWLDKDLHEQESPRHSSAPQGD